jgi:WD40 repeat protein
MKTIVHVAASLLLLPVALSSAEEAASTPSRVAFAPDGRTLAVVGKAAGSPSLELWDVAARRRLWRVPLAGASRGLAWADAKALLVASGPAVMVIDPASGKTTRSLEPHGKGVVAIALTRDGKTLATASDERALLLRDWKADRVVAKCEGEVGEVGHVVFSPDGKQVLAASGNAARLWDTGTGKRLREFSPGPFHLSSVGFMGGDVVTGGYDGGVRVWGEGDGKPRMVFRGTGGVDGVTLSPDGRLLAAWGYSRSVAIYDINTVPPDAKTVGRLKELLARLDDDSYETREKASRDFRSVGFVAEKALRQAVESSPSPEVCIRARVLHQALFSEPRHLKGHTGRVRDAAFSGDGKTLASCSDDGTVRLWDPASGKEMARLP